MGFLGISWFVWSGAALAVALLFAFLWPGQRATGAAGLRHWVLRWGHALVWLLLALSFFWRGWQPAWTGVANAVGLAALAVYLLFLLMLRRR